MGIAEQLVNTAIRYANDNNWHYYMRNCGQKNTDMNCVDCATLISRIIYDVFGWGDFPSSKRGSCGYYWPHISDSGFDTFLTVNGFEKIKYKNQDLLPGDIIITNEKLGHTLMIIDSETLVDANNAYGYGAKSVDIRPLSTYSFSYYAFIYRYKEAGSTNTETESEGFDLSKIWDAKKGNTGGYISSIQAILNAKQNTGLLVDGWFGDLTEAAVKKWQKTFGLTVDGWVGALTWYSLITEAV